jgi:hypothetical protein
MLGVLLSIAKQNLKRQVQHTVMTVVLAAVGGIFICLALGFGIALLYQWLRVKFAVIEALAIMGGGWAVLGIILLLLAFLRSRPRQRRFHGVDPLAQPAMAAAQVTEQAIDNAKGIIRDGSRQQVFGAIIIAALAGFLLGRRM